MPRIAPALLVFAAASVVLCTPAPQGGLAFTSDGSALPGGADKIVLGAVQSIAQQAQAAAPHARALPAAGTLASELPSTAALEQAAPLHPDTLAHGVVPTSSLPLAKRQEDSFDTVKLQDITGFLGGSAPSKRQVREHGGPERGGPPGGHLPPPGHPPAGRPPAGRPPAGHPPTGHPPAEYPHGEYPHGQHPYDEHHHGEHPHGEHPHGEYAHGGPPHGAEHPHGDEHPHGKPPGPKDPITSLVSALASAGSKRAVYGSSLKDYHVQGESEYGPRQGRPRRHGSYTSYSHDHHERPHYDEHREGHRKQGDFHGEDHAPTSTTSSQPAPASPTPSPAKLFGLIGKRSEPELHARHFDDLRTNLHEDRLREDIRHSDSRAQVNATTTPAGTATPSPKPNTDEKLFGFIKRHEHDEHEHHRDGHGRDDEHGSRGGNGTAGAHGAMLNTTMPANQTHPVNATEMLLGLLGKRQLPSANSLPSVASLPNAGSLPNVNSLPDEESVSVPLGELKPVVPKRHEHGEEHNGHWREHGHGGQGHGGLHTALINNATVAKNQTATANSTGTQLLDLFGKRQIPGAPSLPQTNSLPLKSIPLKSVAGKLPIPAKRHEHDGHEHDGHGREHHEHGHDGEDREGIHGGKQANTTTVAVNQTIPTNTTEKALLGLFGKREHDLPHPSMQRRQRGRPNGAQQQQQGPNDGTRAPQQSPGDAGPNGAPAAPADDTATASSTDTASATTSTATATPSPNPIQSALSNLFSSFMSGGKKRQLGTLSAAQQLAGPGSTLFGSVASALESPINTPHKRQNEDDSRGPRPHEDDSRGPRPQGGRPHRGPQDGSDDGQGRADDGRQSQDDRTPPTSSTTTSSSAMPTGTTKPDPNSIQAIVTNLLSPLTGGGKKRQLSTLKSLQQLSGPAAAALSSAQKRQNDDAVHAELSSGHVESRDNGVNTDAAEREAVDAVHNVNSGARLTEWVAQDGSQSGKNRIDSILGTTPTPTSSQSIQTLDGSANAPPSQATERRRHAILDTAKAQENLAKLESKAQRRALGFADTKRRSPLPPSRMPSSSDE